MGGVENSIASVALFCEWSPLVPSFRLVAGVASWLVRRLDSGLPPPPAEPPFDWRKSLRLTGSHGITGTRDIYASSPGDRGITRNKEIANLLRPTLRLPFLSAAPATSQNPLRYCPSPEGCSEGVARRENRELFRVLWVETSPGHPAAFQTMGKKAVGGRSWNRGIRN